MIVAAALVDARGRVLAAQRSYPPEIAGQWEFPGGKVEPGEDPRQAVVREIQEELGVTVTLGTRVCGPDDGDWPLPNGHAMRLWLASTSEVPRAAASHSDLRWLDPEAIDSVRWLPGDLAILPELRRILSEEHDSSRTH